MNVRIGTDPEFVVLNDKGKPVPAHKFYNDKKNKHFDRTYMYPGDGFFRDGYVLEINVHPNTCRALLTNSVRTTLQAAMRRLPAGYTLDTKSAFKVTKLSLRTAPSDVKTFGCEPSWDGYSGGQKVVELDGETHPIRYAGGHLHFGTPNVEVLERAKASDEWVKSKNSPYHEDFNGATRVLMNPDNYPEVAQLFDKYLGRMLTYLYDGGEQFARRMFYGQAGEYRPQKYETVNEKVLLRYTGNYNGVYGDTKTTALGFEYRTPPSEVFNHQAVMSLAFGIGGWVLNNFEVLRKELSRTEAEFHRGVIQTGMDNEKDLPTVTGFYTPEALKGLKLRPEVHKFDFVNGPEGHKGWGEFARDWKLGTFGDLNEQALAWAR